MAKNLSHFFNLMVICVQSRLGPLVWTRRCDSDRTFIYILLLEVYKESSRKDQRISEITAIQKRKWAANARRIPSIAAML